MSEVSELILIGGTDKRSKIGSNMIDRMASAGWCLSTPLLHSVAEQEFDGAIDSVLNEALNVDLKRVRDTMMRANDLSK
jgi:hypothetical protein